MATEPNQLQLITAPDRADINMLGSDASDIRSHGIIANMSPAADAGFDPYAYEKIWAQDDRYTAWRVRLAMALIAISIGLTLAVLLSFLQPVEKITHAIYTTHETPRP